MKKMLILFLILSTVILAGENGIEKILKIQKLRVGTTGDYKPFTYIENGEYTGYDIEVARLIAKELGVDIEFIPTTWKTLSDDLINNKFDMAMGGITKTTKRQIIGEFSTTYLEFGKCFLVRKGEKEKYNSLEKIDKSNVKIGVNIGGTNEVFSSTFISAQIIKYKNNLDVPLAVEKGEVDVMITETPEAIVYEKNNSKLEGSMIDTPLTRNEMGYLMRKDDFHFVNTINFILHNLELNGEIEKLNRKYLSL